MTRRYLFTSESVTEGHPDKLADRISDAILDKILESDPRGRVACETLVTTGLVMVAGEISTETYVDINRIARDTVQEVGYRGTRWGFDGATCGVQAAIQEQSPDIALGVGDALENREGEIGDDQYNKFGAGDQGMMFGYASRETEDLETELMPTPIWLAHRLARQMAEKRKSGDLGYLGPDGKTQVSIAYEDGRPVGIDTILISSQHEDDSSVDKKISGDLMEHVVKPMIPEELSSNNMRFLVNPTGRFVVGGPLADTGLTGRKIIVDSYGGMCSQGGGCFSGKDPTKVDRSGAYFARYVAKNLVAASVLDRCEVRVAYAIGVARPVSVNIDDRGTAKVDPQKLEDLVADFFDFRPAAIIETLDLLRPIYKPTSSYGHFGRPEEDGFPWERTDRSEEFAKLASDL